jgi:hypothetical protein
MEQILQYKGIFYNNKTTHHYYEGGAHFSYYALVKALSELKQDLNKERKNISQESSSSSSKEKIKKKMKEIKKINMPLLSKQKNQSMECIIDNNKKQLLDDIYNKIINEQINKTKNNQIKLLQKIKNEESNKFIKKIAKINKYFNCSIYNVQRKVNMPLIYNQKNKSENKINKNSDETSNNNYNKNLGNYGTLNRNLKKMNSTIGFKENKKHIKYFLMNNNYEHAQSLSSFNKNLNSSKSNGKTIKKYNNNNIILFNKLGFMNKIKNNQNTIHKTNSIDFNIKTNLIRINENFLNKTKLNNNSNKNIKAKLISNKSKSKEKNNMNISIFDFSKLKNSRKFQINKNIK